MTLRKKEIHNVQKMVIKLTGAKETFMCGVANDPPSLQI